ncbi:MAG: PhoH family protein [Deltaproteobacteria bacterium]|nr:PhoH family protein [Deltaproteobacteria bacterium]
MKHFVLDTNILIHDPGAIFHFGDNEVVLPIFVLEEVDQFKKEASERGRNSRELARILDRLRSDGGRLSEGAPLPNGGRLRVATGERVVPGTLRDSQVADYLILMVAVDVRDAHPNDPTIFVTKDVNLRIRADALGLTAVDLEAEERVSLEELYSGMTEIQVSGADVDTFFSQGSLELSRAELLPNQYVLLRDAESPSHSALGRFDKALGKLVQLKKIRDGVWGIRPRNKEQHCALDLLLTDEIKLITLVGKAGTGKTMLALAAGLQKVVEENTYSKMLVSRPIFPLGRDVGYLPGDLEQKLNPWMQPIFDNVEFLMGLSKVDGKPPTGKANGKNGRSYHELIDMGFIEIEPLTYIRGRSIPNQFIIVDEAQNLTPHEVKTIITRVGEHTKIVLTGDPYQIDNPYVDATSNGLTTIVEKFKNEGVAGHVTLSKGERSALAELASNLL